jgi:NADH-quinone oxidoreductase subunit G
VRSNDAVNGAGFPTDRFSYGGLNSGPADPADGRKATASGWKQLATALEHVVRELKHVRERHGAAGIGALVSPHATLEEMHLAQKLVRGLGSENIDFRLRQSDFSTDGKREGATWLGMSIAEFAALDRVLIIGSFLRKDHPLLAQRLRLAAKKGARIALVHTADDELRSPLAHIVAPPALPRMLAEIVVGAAASRAKRSRRRWRISRLRHSRRRLPLRSPAASAGVCSSAVSLNGIRRRPSCTCWRRQSPS